MDWKKQMLAQAVPMAPVMKVEVARIRRANLLKLEVGSVRNWRKRGRAKRPYTPAKNLAIAGKAVRTYCASVRVQDGSEGCKVAHDKAVWDGFAGEVMGASTERVGGSVLARLGKRMGEMNGLFDSIFFSHHCVASGNRAGF